jgi:hypothetical protein
MDTAETKVLVTPVLPTRISANHGFRGEVLCTEELFVAIIRDLIK